MKFEFPSKTDDLIRRENHKLKIYQRIEGRRMLHTKVIKYLIVTSSYILANLTKHTTIVIYRSLNDYKIAYITTLLRS